MRGSARATGEQRAADRTTDAPLQSVVDLLRLWRRHWEAVGAVQRTLPAAARERLAGLPDDPDVALAQTRHLFALEFPPDVVAAFGDRLEEALRAVEMVHGSLSASPGGPGPEAAGRRLDASRLAVNVREVVAAGDTLRMHLQPIVDLAHPQRDPVGFEALARFDTTPYEPPDVWLNRAARAGLLQELELSCVRAALTCLQLLPPRTFVAINVSPETLVSEPFDRLLDDVASAAVVVEVTEHAVVHEYDVLQRAIVALRERGIRLAVDDAGAGFASFRHVLELRPDVIKLDTHLTRGVHRDHGREALMRSLVGFAEDVGATLVAEGIETAEDCATLRAARVPLGQGFLFAHPAPVDDLLGRPQPPLSRAAT